MLATIGTAVEEDAEAGAVRHYRSTADIFHGQGRPRGHRGDAARSLRTVDGFRLRCCAARAAIPRHKAPTPRIAAYHLTARLAIGSRGSGRCGAKVWAISARNLGNLGASSVTGRLKRSIASLRAWFSAWFSARTATSRAPWCATSSPALPDPGSPRRRVALACLAGEKPAFDVRECRCARAARGRGGDGVHPAPPRPPTGAAPFPTPNFTAHPGRFGSPYMHPPALPGAYGGFPPPPLPGTTPPPPVAMFPPPHASPFFVWPPPLPGAAPLPPTPVAGNTGGAPPTQRSCRSLNKR